MFCLSTRSDPFQHLAPLGEYDWQIQDEAIEGNVNTGFFHIMPTASTIAHWKGVLAMDMKQVSRDQHNTNKLLGTEEIRRIPEAETGPAFKAQFESKNGISMNVIPTEVRSFFASTLIASPDDTCSLGCIFVPSQVLMAAPARVRRVSMAWHLSRQSVSIYRSSSSGPVAHSLFSYSPLKYLLPREKGFWQDIDNYYSMPPPLLLLPALSGTQEELLQQMKQFATLAVQSKFD